MEKDLLAQLEKGQKLVATFTAIVVRNAMEEFRIKHLSDEQMKELNPIIQNAIYTTMYAMDHMHESEKAMQFLKHQHSINPEDWEDPELMVDLGNKIDIGASSSNPYAGHWSFRSRKGKN